MSRNKKSTKYIGFSLILIFLAFVISNSIIIYQFEQVDSTIPKTSTIYEEPGIFVDDLSPTYSWSAYAASGKPWFSGSGLINDPYVITDVGITSSDIEIRNSKAYFRIQNCEGIILLRNVTNGHLDNNICTDWVGTGMIIEDSSNNSITNNILNNNKDYGLDMSNSHYNTIFGNTANNNGYTEAGILVGGSYNLIKDNTAKFNSWNGISVGGYNNTVIENTLEQNGMGISVTGFTTIKKNTIFNNTQEGIYVYAGGYNNITSNFIDSNGEHGIYVYHTTNDTIRNNIGNNNVISGMKFEEVDNTKVDNNAMYGCGYQFEGSEVSLASINFDPTNLVNDKPVYLYVNRKNLKSVDFSNAGQVTMISCEDSSFSNVDVSNGTVGITLKNCINNTIKNVNSSNNNLYGIYLEDSTNNTIEGSIINKNGKYEALRDGIYLEYSYDNTFSGNTINNNSRNGIYIHRADKNSILNNEMNYNRDSGIYCEFPSGNLISGNSVQENLKYGIHLDGCVNITIKENTVLHHQHVICDPYCGYTVDQYGIFLEYCAYCNISGNTLGENEIGITLDHCEFNLIHKNHLDADLHNAIWLYHSDNNKVIENLAENVEPFDTIRLWSSNNNTIKKNEIRDDGNGIGLDGAHYNQIIENNVDVDALCITLDSSSYNLIANNTFKSRYYYCFEESDDCVGNIFENNTCEEGFTYTRRGIPGYEMLFLLLIVLITSILIILKQKNVK